MRFDALFWPGIAQPMIVFVSPVRHPATSNSYARVETLLKHTAASIANSTSDDWRYIPVLCQAPQDRLTHPNIDYHVVDFPPPDTNKGSGVPIEAVRRDKGTKTLTGIMKARDAGADYVMLADADDFIHRDLAAYCNDHKGENGWYVDKGLMYPDGGAIIADLDDFNNHCGTSIILSMRLLEPFLDPTLTPTSPEEEIFAKSDQEFLQFILGSHRPVVDYFEKRGTPLKPFPFRASVWLTDSGESHSGIRFNRRPRIVSREEIETFGLPLEMGAGRRLKAAATELPAYLAKHLIRTRLLGRG